MRWALPPFCYQERFRHHVNEPAADETHVATAPVDSKPTTRQPSEAILAWKSSQVGPNQNCLKNKPTKWFLYQATKFWGGLL